MTLRRFIRDIAILFGSPVVVVVSAGSVMGALRMATHGWFD